MDFCHLLQAHSIGVHINPEKAYNKYAPDLVFEDNIADLKYQGTTFHKSREMFGIPPEKAVTFNGKDFRRYKEKYPGIQVLFWVDRKQETWTDRSGKKYVSPESHGVFKAPLSLIEKLINQRAKKWFYRGRVNDRSGNAKFSYVLNTDDLIRLI